jgi:hypothetical protein
MAVFANDNLLFWRRLGIFADRQHLDRGAAVDLEAVSLLEIRDRRLALGSGMPVMVAAEVVAALLE